MHINIHLAKPILIIWGVNCILGLAIAIKQVWIPYMSASNETYSNLQSDPFDGTTEPITYIPDWTHLSNQDKSRRFEDISISEFLPIPHYDLSILADDRGIIKNSLLARYTYPVVYMGNYSLDYKENNGGHPGIDIRAPIGTPVLSIANGVIVKTVESDNVGTKFIVVRHDKVPLPDGNLWTLYSSYLHLSEIIVTEWSKVRKWDMIGRVGITGITTTPHLHLQIDTSDAPFHPYWHFSSWDSRTAGLWFFESINRWLNADLAKKYTINPLIFVENHLSGWNNQNLVANNGGEKSINSITYASSADSKEKICEKRRFIDVSPTSGLGKILYKLIDEKCLFQSSSSKLDPKTSITQREAIMTIMDFYKIPPSQGISSFLDIPIGDELQGYAISWDKKWVFIGNYLYPNKILSKEEFIELVVRLGNLPKNPSQMKIYADVENLNPHLSSLQDYWYSIKARWGKIYPKSILNRQTMIQILGNLQKK